MTTKTFLTSAVAMGFIAPVMAAPTNTGTFPSGGLMQADYTYTNAATSTNMDGVYEGTVNAEAQYENILYTIGAGKYLPAGAEAVIDCNQSGYFCPGLQSQVQYDENNPQGLTSCSTATNGAYTLSDGTGSTADSCYRQCSGNVTISHATGVTGLDYYGNGVDTCEPTGCENGYHVKAATPDLTTTIGVSEAGSGYTSNDYNGDDYDTDNMSNIIIANDPMAFAVDYGNKGMIKGHGRCSTRAGANNTWTNTYNVIQSNFVETLADETDPDTGGQYCYCHLDSYTPVSGSAIALSGPWVFDFDYDDAGLCANDCALSCANYLRNDVSAYLAFRAAVFGSLGASPAMCEANTITINWNGTTEAAINANNAGVATYDGDIRTPQSATPVPGKRFTGWRFSNPTKVSVGQ